MNSYLQNPVRFKMDTRTTGMNSFPARAIYNWLVESNHMERWLSTDGQSVEGIIRADRFAHVLPKLQRFARGAVEFYTVGR